MRTVMYYDINGFFTFDFKPFATDLLKCHCGVFVYVLNTGILYICTYDIASLKSKHNIQIIKTNFYESILMFFNA